MMDQKMNGAKFIAETFKGYGITHVFFVEIILLKLLMELEALGIKRILTHSVDYFSFKYLALYPSHVFIDPFRISTISPFRL